MSEYKMPSKTIKSGDAVTEKNSPDFSLGEIVSVDPGSEERASSTLLYQSRNTTNLGYIVLAVGALIALVVFTDPNFMSAGNIAGVAIACFMAVLPIITGAIMLIKSYTFRSLINNGEKRFYAFEVCGKATVKGAKFKHGTQINHYLFFGDVRCLVDGSEYSSTSEGEKVCCVVFSSGKKEYFGYLGRDF